MLEQWYFNTNDHQAVSSDGLKFSISPIGMIEKSYEEFKLVDGDILCDSRKDAMTKLLDSYKEVQELEYNARMKMLDRFTNNQLVVLLNIRKELIGL